MRVNVALVESPLQLRNAHDFLVRRQALDSCSFIISLSGKPGWDLQMVQLAHALDLQEVDFLAPGDSGWSISTELQTFLDFRTYWCLRPRLLGSPSLTRFWALLGRLWRLKPAGLRWNRFDYLVTGNPGQLIPFWPLFIGGSRHLTIVDDGLSILALASKRLKTSSRPGRGFISDLLSPPEMWRSPISVYTMFGEKLRFNPNDDVIPNRRLHQTGRSIKIINRECWILGSSAVEESALPLDRYQEVLENVLRLLSQRRLSIRYLPHRRESDSKVQAIASRLDFQVLLSGMPVEELVRDRREVAQVVIGFGSTALDLLALFVPAKCQIWSHMLKAPGSKLGHDSPEAIQRWHALNPRIQLIDASLGALPATDEARTKS